MTANNELEIQSAWETFNDLIPESPRPRVLEASCQNGKALQQWIHKGWEAEGFASSVEAAKSARLSSGAWVWKVDYHFLKLKENFYDGVWSSSLFEGLSPVACKRVITLVYEALKPSGFLGLVFDVSDYNEHDVSSLIKQSGFSLIKTGKSIANLTKRAIYAQK